VVVIVGGSDDVVIDLNEQARGAMTCETELVIVPGATHLFEEAGALERVADLAAGWFERRLRGETWVWVRGSGGRRPPLREWRRTAVAGDGDATGGALPGDGEGFEGVEVPGVAVAGGGGEMEVGEALEEELEGGLQSVGGSGGTYADVDAGA
jgi:hypothetical protein